MPLGFGAAPSALVAQASPFSREQIDKVLARKRAEQTPLSSLTQSAPIEQSTMSPEELATIGGIADSISTYAALRKPGATEGNPLYSSLHNKPLATGLAVGGTSLAMAGVRHYLRKKWPRVADALAAQQGGQQLSFGVNNLDTREGGFDAWNNALARNRRRK